MKTKDKDIVFVNGNKRIILKDGDKANLKFNIDFEIEIVPNVWSREIVINDVKIKRSFKRKLK